MADFKTTCRIYSAWNYEQEIADLNRASEQGWQLVRGGAFFNRFQKNPALRYRYQLDFRKVEDMGRYIETFREQGWEYVSSTFNGWHYFRKFYDPAQPESAYEIFTDRESLAEMRRRWANIAAGISAALAVFALIFLIREIRRPMLPTLVLTLTLLLECGILLRGVWVMRSPERVCASRGDLALFPLLLIVIVAGSVLAIALTLQRPNLTSRQSWESRDPLPEAGGPSRSWDAWLTFDIRYPDFYYADFSVKADSPLALSLVSPAGTVYAIEGDDFEEEDVRVFLEKGRYGFFIDECGDGAADIGCGIG